MNYYYLTDENEVVGPKSIEELKDLLASNALQPNAQVCGEGEQTWQPVSDIMPSSSKVRFPSMVSPPAPARIERKIIEPVTPANKTRSLLLLALTAMTVLLIAAVAFLLWRRDKPAQRPDTEVQQLRDEVARLKASQVSIQQAPKVETPVPKTPLLSEESKARIATFIEKASKLRAMTEQGVRLENFKAQLSEVRGSWDSISTIGLPHQLRAETEVLQTTVSAWELAEEIWSNQSNAEAESLRNSGAIMLFTLQSGSLFRSRLAGIQEGLQAGSVSLSNAPDFADTGAFEIQVVKQFNDLTEQVADKIAQSQHAYEIDILNRKFQDVVAKFERNLPDGFVKSFAYGDLRGIPDLITKIGEERKKILGGGLDPISSAQADGNIAQLRVAIVKAFLPIYKKGMDGTHSEIDSTKIVDPKAAIQWCFTAAGTALDAAKNAISSKLKQDEIGAN